MVDATEKMTAAGRRAWRETNTGPISDGDLARIYTAMHSAREVDEGVRLRVAKAICAANDDPSCFNGDSDILRCFGPQADAAIAAMGEGDVR